MPYEYDYGPPPTKEGQRRYEAIALRNYQVADRQYFDRKTAAVAWAKDALTRPGLGVVRVNRQVQGWYLDLVVTGEEQLVWKDDGQVFEAGRTVTREEAEATA